MSGARKLGSCFPHQAVRDADSVPPEAGFYLISWLVDAMPFPTVVIELPQDYTRKRVLAFDAGNHAPNFVIVRHEPKADCVLVAMHRTSHQVLTRLLKLDSAWTLEEMWAKGARTWDAKDSLGMTPEESALGSGLSKLALNVCLMATAYGFRSLGPANASHYERPALSEKTYGTSRRRLAV